MRPKYLSRFLLKEDWRILAAIAVGLMIAAGCFFDLIEDLNAHDPLIWPDYATYVSLQRLRTVRLDSLMIAITELGDSFVVVTLTLTVGSWLLWRRAKRTLAYWLAAMAGGSLINTAIKIALHRARPTDLHYSGWNAFSFPSGHSTTNALLYGFVAIFILRQSSPYWRVPIGVCASLWVMAIGFSRLYLGAHWLSDVVGGLVFGSLWLTLLARFYFYQPAEPLDVRQLALLVALTLAVAGGIHIALDHAADTQNYTVNPCLASPHIACDK